MLSMITIWKMFKLVIYNEFWKIFSYLAVYIRLFPSEGQIKCSNLLSIIIPFKINKKIISYWYNDPQTRRPSHVTSQIALVRF